MENQKIHGISPQTLLSAVFADAADGIILVNAIGEIIYVNKSISRIFQYSEKEILGQNFSFLLPGSDQNPKADDIKMVAKGISQQLESKIEVNGRKKDGNQIPVFLSISRFAYEDEIYYSGLLRDISDFKNAQTALIKERTLLKKYLFVTNSIIIELDAFGSIMMFNHKAEEITGYKTENVLGQNWFDLVLNPQVAKVFKLEWKSIFSGEQELIEFLSHKITTKDGDIKIIKWHSISNKNERGEIESILASGIDITQLMETERELKLLNNKLEKEVEKRTNELVNAVNGLLNTNRKLDNEIVEKEKVQIALLESEAQLRLSLEKELELNQLKSRFLSMASHEFKTPISTVLSSISLLERYEEGEISEKKQKHFKRIKGALNHMTFMLDDFFSITKFEEGRINTKEETILLNDFCMKIIETFQNNLKVDQTISLKALEHDFEFNTDPNLLKQIILNLLSNASKYSDPKEQIIIRIIEKEKDLNFEIEDRGMGIPPEDQKHLFTRFFRAGNVNHIKGSGLGLNIVRDYVKLLNGEISVKSKVGKGSLFIVSLPKNQPWKRRS